MIYHSLSIYHYAYLILARLNPGMEYCASMKAQPTEDLSQIVEGYLEFIKLKVLSLFLIICCLYDMNYHVK